MGAQPAERLDGRSCPTQCIDDVANRSHGDTSNRLLDFCASRISNIELGADGASTAQNTGMPEPTASQLKIAFGARLKLTREALGYTSAAVAAAGIGVSENTYTMWERGDRYPNAINLMKIKRAFGVTVDFLYFGDRQGLASDLVRLLNAAERLSA
jgi:DNA-binding XRE family transcriptional regulator